MHSQVSEKKFSFWARGSVLLGLVLLIAGAAFFLLRKTTDSLTADGIFYVADTAVRAVDAGMVSSVEVQPGEFVQRGRVLVRFNDAPAQAALLAEQEELVRLRRLLPPEYLEVSPADSRTGAAAETLAERHERRREKEESAVKMLQEVCDREAQAAVAYSRASALASQGKVSLKEKAAAEASLESARRDCAEARRIFEETSTSRAADTKEIRRIQAAQSAAGADGIPLEARLDAYARQRERVASAQGAFEKTLIRAPHDGYISRLSVAQGQMVEPGAPCVFLREELPAFEARALFPTEESRLLALGMQAEIHINGLPPLPGAITAIKPAKAVEDRVTVALSDTVGGAVRQSLPDSAEAVVVIFPGRFSATPVPLGAIPLPAPSAGGGVLHEEAAPSVPSVQAAPPAAPVSIETPFGGPEPQPVPQPEAQSRQAAPAPVVKTGNMLPQHTSPGIRSAAAEREVHPAVGQQPVQRAEAGQSGLAVQPYTEQEAAGTP